MLQLKNITIKSTEKAIVLKGINAKFPPNSISLIIGPNGAGKTSIAEAIAGTTNLIVDGEISFNQKDITKLPLDERAKLGIFLAYQHPVEIPGVNILNFLHNIYKNKFGENIDIWEFHEIATQYLNKLKLSETFLERNINEGFSGGEKKKFEILQILILRPKVVILDEIDSGLDVDSIKEIFRLLLEYQKEEKASIILISHSTQILEYVKPDKAFVLKESKMQEGDINLVKQIFKTGYGK